MGKVDSLQFSLDVVSTRISLRYEREWTKRDDRDTIPLSVTLHCFSKTVTSLILSLYCGSIFCRRYTNFHNLAVLRSTYFGSSITNKTITSTIDFYSAQRDHAMYVNPPPALLCFILSERGIFISSVQACFFHLSFVSAFPCFGLCFVSLLCNIHFRLCDTAAFI